MVDSPRMVDFFRLWDVWDTQLLAAGVRRPTAFADGPCRAADWCCGHRESKQRGKAAENPSKYRKHMGKWWKIWRFAGKWLVYGWFFQKKYGRSVGFDPPYGKNGWFYGIVIRWSWDFWKLHSGAPKQVENSDLRWPMGFIADLWQLSWWTYFQVPIVHDTYKIL